MRIALCDDDNRIMDILEEKLKKYSEEHNIEFTVKRFLGGTELLAYDLKEIDLLFLDMEMPGLNGVEVATEIRKTNRSMAIIFVTAFEKFVFESFKVNAFRYLLKPLDDNKFTEALDALISQNNNDDDYLCFSFQNENYRIAYNNIIYIEIMRDKIWIHCYGKTYRWRGTLKQITEKLIEKGFFQVHRSYLINMSKIKSYSSNNIVLDEDCNVPISKYRLDAFREEYIKHWSKVL